MVNNEEIVEVRNFTSQRIAYLIPERSVRRDFSAFETKEITAGELRELWFKSGGKTLLQHYLGVNNEELAHEFGISKDQYTHEYSWTKKDIDRVLQTGSEDELADALDYAPLGIMETLVNRAVELRISDMNKRKLIKEMTGKDVSKMINYVEELDLDAPEHQEKVQRRVQTQENKKKTGRRVG